MKVVFLEPARQELDEAVSYYNQQVAGLGNAFLIEAVAAIERIRRFPQGWHPLSKNVRRCRLRRFPYGLIITLPKTNWSLLLSLIRIGDRPIGMIDSNAAPIDRVAANFKCS